MTTLNLPGYVWYVSLSANHTHTFVSLIIEKTEVHSIATYFLQCTKSFYFRTTLRHLGGVADFFFFWWRTRPAQAVNQQRPTTALYNGLTRLKAKTISQTGAEA